MALALPARASVVFNVDDTRPLQTAYGVRRNARSWRPTAASGDTDEPDKDRGC